MPAGLEGPVLKRIIIAAGLIAAAIGVIGLIGLASGITAFTSVLPGYKSIAVSAALIWIFLGLVLVLHATRPHIGKLVLAVRVVLAGIVMIEAIELLLSLMGSHSVIEILSVRVGSVLLGNPTTPISPAASALIIPAAIILLLLLSPGANKKRNQQIRDAGGITGLAIALAAFAFVLSYMYGAPFLNNTALVPMALMSALAGLFTGIGLVAAAGKAAIPLKYFTGSSTRARLLRVFVPLVIILTLVQDILFVIIADVFRVQDALILSVCIVISGFVTAWVIARFSGRIGRDLERAEQALVQKNEDLGAMNEELTAITEEVRQNNDELLRKEKALRESQQRNTFLADILDKSAQPFGVGYPDGKLGIVNKAFEDLTGYSADKLRGIDWVGVLTPPEWHEVERQRLAELHRTGKPVWYEKEYIRKDGTRVPIELLVHLVANEDGTPQYYYSFITDITARKQAEHKIESLLSEVRSERDRLSALINSISDEIWFADTEKRFVLTNPSALREFGTEYGDSLNVEEMASSLEVFRPDGSPRPVEEAPPLRALAGEIVRNQEEIIRTPVQGELRYRQVTSTPVRDAKGTIIGSVSVVRDISDSRKAEEEILNKNEELNALNEELTSTQEELLQKIEEITKAGVALREAQTRTATVLEGIADTFYSLDNKWRFTAVNPAAEKAPFGRSAAELLGRVIWELYPALVGTRIHRHYLAAAEKHSLEHYVAQSPLNQRWYEVFMQGRMGGLDVYMRDITELKKGEETLLRRNEALNAAYEEIAATQEELQQSNDELIRSEQELRKTSQYLENLINYANAPIVVWDPNFVITRFNHAFEELTGRTAREIIGQRLEVLFPPRYLDASMEIIRKTMYGERLRVVEIPILNRGGENRIVLWNSATLFEPDGTTIQSTIAQGNDITERKMTEAELLRRNEDLNAANEEILATQEELQRSHDELLLSEQELRKTSQYLENLINYANAPIVVWDPHYVITRFNHAFEELTGRTARDIIGQRLEVLFPPQYLDASMEIIRKTMSGERLRVVEIPILNRRGEIRVVLWNSATLYEADGKTVQSTIAQGNDITERYIAEAELEERNEELNNAIEELTQRGRDLNEALKEKEVLLSEVHHRVKNNLTAFISLLSLESTYDDSPAGLALKKDLQNRARSMALIHETLYRTKKYSRVDMDVYLSTLVGQVVSSYETLKSVKTVVDTHGITLDLSRATPCGLIINELLTNSLKYAFPVSFDCEMIRGVPCLIEVSLIQDDGAYLLTVRDNGSGLPEDLDITTTKTLGLKLVNFLAKHQLRASIEVNSDDGAEFRFRFRDKV